MSERTSSTQRSALMIQGQIRQFMPLETFREMYGLDSGFGITLFQPKDYRSLGSIEKARHIISTIPASYVPPRNLWKV